MYAYNNPAQDEPEAVHARLNPRPQVVAAPAILYARKEPAGAVNIYHDHAATDLLCTFARDLSNKPRRNSRKATINGQARLLFWID